MKILHIYKDYHPVMGGIENHLKMLAEGQVQRGLDVTVLVTSLTHRTTVEEINGVRVVKAARLVHTASTPLSLSFLAWVRRLPADIVHLHFPYPPGEVTNLLLGRGRKTVITYHSDVIRQRLILALYRPLLWRVLATADQIIATSANYIHTSPYLCRMADKCVVIPLGIDLEPFNHVDHEQVANIRRRYGTPLLLFVGRLRYYKGLDTLIEAMRDIEARLLVVGSGPLEAEWRSSTERCGVADRVVFLGQIPDEVLSAYYAAADLFVLPASHRSEAFGAVLLEAMAAGVPVISTELGTGTSFVNVHGETGLVVPPRDPQALKRAIGRLLEDEALRRRLGEKAQVRAQTFSKETMVEAVIRLYKDLLSPTPGLAQRILARREKPHP